MIYCFGRKAGTVIYNELKNRMLMSKVFQVKPKRLKRSNGTVLGTLDEWLSQRSALYRMLWIGEHLLPQRRFDKGSNHSFFVEMLIS